MKKDLKIGTRNQCNGVAMKMDYVKNILPKKKFDVLFLQETEIPNGHDFNL